MPARFDLTFGPVLRIYVDRWRALFGELSLLPYSNEVETRYETGIHCDDLQSQWSKIWAEHWPDDSHIVDCQPLFTTMSIEWPSALMRLAWSTNGIGELDWVSPSTAEVTQKWFDAERQKAAYTFGWAIVRATQRVTARLESQGAEPKATDLTISAILEGLSLTEEDKALGASRDI